MRRDVRAIVFALACSGSGLFIVAQEPPPGPELPVARTAAPGPRLATLRFRVIDAATMERIPARLVFRTADDPEPALFVDAKADPLRLAVRRNALTTLAGEGAITIPAGSYVVEVGRGLEWSLERRTLVLEAGRSSEFEVALMHEVETTGWIGADFHLHTVTFSRHGDAELPERVITLIGEGLEFAAATDHNHVTDYGATLNSLQGKGRLTAVPGNEVSTPIGHFNAFPLDPKRKIADPLSRSAKTLFAFLHAEPNGFGVVPVVQVNHPRWGGLDYFGFAGLDPISGTSADPAWSSDFDTIEVLNENEGWGYEDAETAGTTFVGEGRHSVLEDWFRLLQRGHAAAAVGNSDSHTVSYELAGWPRNLVRSSTDDPGRIDVREIAAALRRGEVVATSGPFVTFSVNGAGQGELATGTVAKIALRVQAASWISCDRLRIVVNGDERAVVPVPPSNAPLRYDGTIEVPLTHDAWIVVLAEGDRPLTHFPRRQQRPVLPRAIANPIRIDADGDGHWTPPAERLRARVVALGDDATRLVAEVAGLAPSERALATLLAGEAKVAAAKELAAAALADSERRVRLAGAKVAGPLRSPELLPAIEALFASSESDPYARVTAVVAGAPLAPERAAARALEIVRTVGAPKVGRYGRELDPLLPGGYVRPWRVLGPIPMAGKDALVGPELGPELDPAARLAAAPDGETAPGFVDALAQERGYLDLAALFAAAGKPATQTLALAEVWLHRETAGSVPFLFGSDDGARLYLDGTVILTDRRQQAADPWTHFGELPLRAGWSRLVAKIENAGGGHGLYLRLLDPSVRASRSRE